MHHVHVHFIFLPKMLSILYLQLSLANVHSNPQNCKTPVVLFEIWRVRGITVVLEWYI